MQLFGFAKFIFAGGDNRKNPGNLLGIPAAVFHGIPVASQALHLPVFMAAMIQCLSVPSVAIEEKMETKIADVFYN